MSYVLWLDAVETQAKQSNQLINSINQAQGQPSKQSHLMINDSFHLSKAQLTDSDSPETLSIEP